MPNYKQDRVFPVSYLESDDIMTFRTEQSLKLKMGDTVTFKPDGLRNHYLWEIKGVGEVATSARKGHQLVTCSVNRITREVYATQ